MNDEYRYDECRKLLMMVVKSLFLRPDFTGKVTITLNFHAGTCGGAVIGQEEGFKLTDKK